jgi:hypothetical protein
MKRAFLLLSIFLFCCNCFAQHNKFGISLAAGIPFQDPKYFSEGVSLGQTYYKLQRNSFFSELIGSYNYNDTIGFRLNAGITLLEIDQKESYYISGNYCEKFGFKDQQRNIHFAPGVVWKLTNKKMLLYGGAEIPFSVLGKTKDTYNYTETEINTGNTHDAGQSIRTVPGGYSIGIGGIIGVSYFPCKMFSIETEFLPSLLYSSLSGKLTRTGESFYPVSTTYKSWDLDYKYNDFCLDERFSIRLTYWFGNNLN